jgi:hypothetical protein
MGVAERLGHATVVITLDTYSHVVGELSERRGGEGRRPHRHNARPSVDK